MFLYNCREEKGKLTNKTKQVFKVLQNESWYTIFHMKTSSFSSKSNSFSFEWFQTKTRFEREAKGNSEMGSVFSLLYSILAVVEHNNVSTLNKVYLKRRERYFQLLHGSVVSFSVQFSFCLEHWCIFLSFLCASDYCCYVYFLRFQVIIGTVMQIGPAMSTYGAIMFVSLFLLF